MLPLPHMGSQTISPGWILHNLHTQQLAHITIYKFTKTKTSNLKAIIKTQTEVLVT